MNSNDKPNDLDIPRRVEELRRKTGLTYAELAKEIGIGRTSLFKLANGTETSPKLIKRFEATESRLQQNNTSPTSCFRGNPLVSHALRVYDDAPNDGHWPPRVTLIYRQPSPDLPKEIQIEPPPTVRATNLVLRGVVTDDYEELVLKCLPKEYAKRDFFNNLTTGDYIRLIQACLRAILGPNWRNESEALKLQNQPPASAPGVTSELATAGTHR